jgi:hypothetical protein
MARNKNSKQWRIKVCEGAERSGAPPPPTVREGEQQKKWEKEFLISPIRDLRSQVMRARGRGPAPPTPQSVP